MRKSLICLALAAAVASVNVQAQEKTGGGTAGGGADGVLKAKKLAGFMVGSSVLYAIAANTNGNSPEREVIPGSNPPPPPPPPAPTCDGDDALVDGVCIGSTITSTVTGTGTATAIVTVPVTFTYSPSN